MKYQNEIEAMRDKACDEVESPTKKRVGMSYEDGVLAALDWVLETMGDDEGPFE